MSQSGTQTLERGLEVLVLCAEAGHRGISLDEIVETLNLSRSTAYRIVQRMKELGFMRGAMTRSHFLLGYKLIYLAQAADAQAILKQIAQPFLEQLAEKTKETAFITVRDGWRALCLTQVESPHALRLSYRTGRSLPLYAGASAKVMLAFMTPAEQNKVLSEPKEVFTDPAFVATDFIRRDLAKIRKQGYAISAGETDTDAKAVCVPILAVGNRRLLGGLSVAGPTPRFDEQNNMRALLEDLKSVARSIAHEYASLLERNEEN